MPLAEAVQAVLDSRITHSVSGLAILKAAWWPSRPSLQ